VDARVTLSRFQYAFLSFDPSLRETPGPLKWLQLPAQHPDHRARELGIKIVSGFELYLQEQKRKMEEGAAGTADERVDALAGVMPTTMIRFLQTDDGETERSQTDILEPDDSDAWLTINPGEVDDLLARYAPRDRVEEEQASQIFEGLSQFLSKKSPLEGVEPQQEGLEPVRFDLKRFDAILSRDPVLEEIFLQMESELAAKTSGGGEVARGVQAHLAVAEDMLTSIKAQRQCGVEGPSEPLLRMMAQSHRD